MIGGVVVTHGRLASELVAAAQIIVGEIAHITAVAIDWQEDVEKAHQVIEQAINQVNQGQGVLLLTDMFGGTPTNLAMTFAKLEKIEVITGVNLPMVIRLAGQMQDETLEQVARKVREQGQKNIYLASEVLTGKR
jgi:mannose PTS system EIIA component